MLSYPEYLLIKLNEECIELADAALLLSENPDSVELQSEFCGEYNDILGIVSMMPSAGLNINLSESVESLKETNAESREAIQRYSREIATQALRAAKIVTKCMTFGLKETYVGATLHNTDRLMAEVEALFLLSSKLSSNTSVIKFCLIAQNNKRLKMKKYLAISERYETISATDAQTFELTVNKMDIS
jgi:hypothetical protein